VTGILCDFLEGGGCVVTANWSAQVYRFKETHTFYGRYRYELQPRGESWVIRKKRILVLNDAVPTAMDIYCL
jgi:3-phenylpropionate/cinnamic acid dioxygenase small subunit